MPRLVSFFCSDFAAYIRKNAVSYGFQDKIFMLNAAFNRGRPIFGGDFYSKKYGISCFSLVVSRNWLKERQLELCKIERGTYHTNITHTVNISLLGGCRSAEWIENQPNLRLWDSAVDTQVPVENLSPQIKLTLVFSNGDNIQKVRINLHYIYTFCSLHWTTLEKSILQTKNSPPKEAGLRRSW